MDLTSLLDKITKLEETALPLFILSPQSQALAGIAFVAEQSIFAWIESLHKAPAAPTK
jgi:hypothetical protein